MRSYECRNNSLWLLTHISRHGCTLALLSFSLFIETDDFKPITATITFQPDQEVACTNIPIVNDDIPENDEPFQVDFVPPAGTTARPGGSVVAAVTIIDDDGKVYKTYSYSLCACFG